MELGEQIATLREEKALTQVELAEKAKISPSTLSQIESGKVPRPHVGTVRKIARALGVEPVELRKVSPEELTTRPKVEPPLPFEPDEERRQITTWWIEALEKYFNERLDKYDAELQDSQSPHFRTATTGTLWLAGVEEEASDWNDWVREQVAPLLPPAKGEGWKQLLDFELVAMVLELVALQFGYDHVVEHGKLRIEEMADVPDDLSVRRLEKATADATESRRRLEELRAAAGE
jgi:transcriptional regulator with XRE-family HTH domain